jgi:hypothetical protein
MVLYTAQCILLAGLVYIVQVSFIVSLFIRRVQHHYHNVCASVQWCSNRSDGGALRPAKFKIPHCCRGLIALISCQSECPAPVQLHTTSFGERGIAVQLRSTQTNVVKIMRKLHVTTETIQRLSAVGSRRLPHCKWWPGGGGVCWRAATAPLTVSNQTFYATTLTGSRFPIILKGEN